MSLIINPYSFSSGSGALLTGLVSYWEMNEASGNAIDSHGSNTLTDTNTVGSTAGKVGNARDFEDANNERFTITSNSTLQTGDIDFTFACWVNFESTGAYHVVLGKDDTGQREYLLYYDIAASRIKMAVYTPTPVEATANTLGAPSTSTWYFVVGWHDATANTVNIQVNDGSVDSQATGGALSASGTADFIIGNRGFGATLPMDGLIDEVGFWKRTLTAPEKTFLYNSGNGRSYADVAAY